MTGFSSAHCLLAYAAAAVIATQVHAQQAQPAVQPAQSEPVPSAASAPVLSAGPMIGHTEPGLVTVWCRAAAAGPVAMRYRSAGEQPAHKAVVHTTATEENDLCVVFTIADALAGEMYTVQIVPGNDPDKELDPSLPTWSVKCPSKPRDEKKVSIIFGSCAGDPFDKPLPVWDAVAAEKPGALCLIGDTPYIDSTDLAHQRMRYRGFYTSPQLAAVLASTPTYGVWDDHDFGRNDSNGKLRGKEHARRAFLEYHANAGAGDGSEGVFSSFRRGAVEVFLIDARWFSGVEKSYADETKPTLLGEAQWHWLRNGLQKSGAPFKLLVSGMIWNDSVRPNKTDYWGNYAYERQALFEFIRAEKITGVVLVGGDIHRSRLLRWPTQHTGVAYPIYELISSPLGSNVLENANQPNDMLLWDSGSPRSFMVVEAEYGETPTLVVRWRNEKGETLHEMKTTELELCPPTR